MQIQRQREEQSFIGISEQWSPREYFDQIMHMSDELSSEQ